MKKLILSLAVCQMFLSSALRAEQQVVVVAHADHPITGLEKHEVRNLFMGGAGADLAPVTLKPGAKTRLIFNTRVVGLTESRIQSYWAQMRFSGREKAPVEVESEEDMLRYLLENEGSVGYLPADTEVPKELTVLYTSG